MTEEGRDNELTIEHNIIISRRKVKNMLDDACEKTGKRIMRLTDSVSFDTQDRKADERMRKAYRSAVFDAVHEFHRLWIQLSPVHYHLPDDCKE